MTQGIEIFNVVGMAEAIRYTEYKDIYSAISEIVDNSIEANAKNILIISNEGTNGKGEKVLKDLAILDNGDGMDFTTLQNCLVFGSSSRKERKSIGRFGVGLGQASMFAAPRVEVFSWQHSSEKRYVYLDANLMKEGKQKRIEVPIEKEVPVCFKGFLNINLPNIGSFNFHRNGTMVVWNSLDKNVGKPQTFYNKLSEELGRRFRYYLNNGVNIIITTTQHSPIEKIKIVDPLFIMDNSRYLADKTHLMSLTDHPNNGESIFEPYISDRTPNGIKELNLSLETSSGKPFFSIVKLKCSVVKEKYYWEGAKKLSIGNPGNSDIGKKVSKFDYISVVRSDREIQTDKFGIYNSMNKNENRWWSLELSFSPEMDEFFKLSNNKQKVEMMTNFSSKETEGNDENSLEAQAWRLIIDNINLLIRKMQDRNKKLASNVRKDEPVIPKTVIQTPPTSRDIPNQNGNKPNIADNKNDLTSIESYIDVYYRDNKNNKIFNIEQHNKTFNYILYEQNEFFKKFNDYNDFMLGFNFFASMLSNIRDEFVLYEEEKIFEKLINNLNRELQFVIEEMEQE